MSFEPGSHEWQLQAFAGAGLGGEESILTQFQGLYPAIDQAVFENFVQQFKNSINAKADQYQLVQTNVTETVALDTAQQQVYDELTNFLARPDAGQLVEAEFGQDWDHDELIGSIKSYLTSSQTPNVEVVATATTEKAFRAGYSVATKTIYFDRDFLALTTPEELVEVYLEELGHYWQSQTKGVDIVGDEGVLLAALILEKDLSETEKQQISQEDDRHWLLLDGQWLAIEQASWLQTEELKFAEGRPGIFYLPETNLDFLTTLSFQAKEKDASYNNEIGFYLTDAQGRVNGINPGQGGYTETVLRQAERRILFNPNSTEGNWQEVELEGGVYFGLYLVADGSGEQFLNLSSDDPNRPKVYFSDTSANPDGVEHMRWQALGNGIYTVQWEDLWSGGDNDFNDAIFTLGQKGIKTPGNSGQLVPFNVDWVSSDASYANEMGLYYVDDARGMINGIAPGDPRYAQEVFKAGNYQTLFEQGTVGGNQQITLAGGQYIGLYLISNSNRNDFLRLNPTNAPGAGPVAYFSYQRANPSDISYLSHYSGAQLGWEDFLGGGDKDYNDLIFNLGFGSPRNIRADVESVNITEGDSETKTAEITISLSEAHQNPVSLNYQTIDGTAKANDDYLPASGILTFAVGETQKRFSVSIVGDLIDEADEFLTIQLGDPRNVVLETSEAFITIYDNDKIADLPVNHPPIADEDKTITLQEDSQPVALNINSPSDSDDDPLTITVIQLPDDTKGRITLADGTIVSMGDEITLESLTSLRYAPLADANGDGGDFVYTVTDGNGGSDSQTISFIITPVDDNPSLNNPPVADADKTITLDEDSQPIELNINSPTDIDNDTLTIAITQLPDKSKGRITLADSIIINEGDEITIASLTSLIYTPLADANGNGGDFVYTVTDGKGGSNTQRISFVIQPSNLIVSAIASNNAPEFTTNPELEIVAGNNYTYDANAVDADNDTLFYSLLLAPQGLTIDHSTGIITWESPTLGNYNISILVEDAKGGRDTQTYTLGVVTNVIDTSQNRPPVFVSTPVVYGNLNTEYRYDANATDVDNDNLTYSVINAPNGLAINQNTGVIDWTPTTLGETEITLQVSDSKGGIATQVYTLLVLEEETDNYAPVIISEAILKASTNQNYIYDVNAIDPDEDNLTYSLVDATQGMTINAVTGEILWDTADKTVGNYNVTVRVTDDQGGVDTQEFVIALTNTSFGIIEGVKWEDTNSNGFRDTSLVQGASPDVIFVLDVSGSADDSFVGTSVGDMNNDGLENTRLDAEIAGFIALNQQLITQGLGTRANVAVIVFSGFSANADMDLVANNLQLTTTPTADINNNGVADVAEILKSITSGAFGVGNFTGTNIEAALRKVEETFLAIGTEIGNGNLIFLTDGESNRGGSINDEVERLKAQEFNLSAFGVGENASLAEIQSIDPDGFNFTSTDQLLGVFGGLEGEKTFIEPGLAGVTVYLDLNNNGILNINEPTQITISDDPSTPNIDETGQYQFTGLEAGTYIVREVVPTDYEQTYPVGNSSNQGDGYADVILEFVSGGNAPSPLIEPYGSTGGLPLSSSFNGNGLYTVEPVNPNVILGAPPPSPIVGSNPQVDWLALPIGSYVTVGFTDEIIIDGEGDDIFIRSFDPEDSANEFADVFVSSDGTNFELLGRVNERGLVSLDLEDINFTKPVVAVRVQGVDNLGTSPGFDLIGVEVLPNSNVSPDFYTVQLEAGETISNINFGNKKIDQPIPNQAPVFTSVAPTIAQIGELLTYQAIATDANNDRLAYSLLNKPEGMAVDAETGILIWQPKQNQIGNNRVVLRVSDGKGGITTQEFFLNTKGVNTPPQIISSPNTAALINDTYTYEVRATDFDNDTLTYSLINSPEGMTINANTGFIEYTPSALGTQTIQVRVSDGFGGTSTQTYQLQVLAILSNNLPTITSTPQILIGAGGVYQYDVEATDPENTALTYGLSTKPDGMTIDANTGLITWQTQAVTNGDFQVTVTATDADGGIAYQNYYIRVAPNQAPVITSQPLEIAQFGFTYEYDVIAGDVEGDRLFYRLTEAPQGLTVDEFGRIRWQPNTQVEGVYPVTVEVNDGRGGIVTQTYNLTVTDDDINNPILNLGFSSNVINIGETVNLQVRATDNVGVETLTLTANGTPLTLTPNVPNNQINNANFNGQEAGLYRIIATATDEAGNTGVQEVEIRVVDPSDTEAPFVEIDPTNLQSTQAIIKTTTDIIATVTDENLEFYRVEIASIEAINLDNIGDNDPDYILLNEGDSNITNQTVATLDPRLFANGSYLVRITAFDFSGNGNVQGVIVNVNGQNKPGDFSLEYTDLSIPLTGIPIEITRRYNSLESSTQGDFGYGWELGLQDANIVEASPDGRDLSDNASDIFGTLNTFSVGTRITLNTPDGRRVSFTFNPVISGASLFGAIYAPSFTPDAGVFDKLEAESASLSIRSDGTVGAFLFSFLGYNPSQYKLTTKDGTVYNYDQHFGLIDVTDRNGNQLTFSEEGIASSTGAKIDFIRDGQGRITEIIDPDGKSIKYTYDAKGDLIEVIDRTNNTTELVYDDPNRQHFLTEIIDPLGRSATRTEYDENGQISKIIDANGNELNIAFDNATNSQTIRDPFGKTITRVFDAQGNVIQEVDQLGGITLRTYDEDNNLLSETDPEGSITSYTYDDRGNKLTEADGEGNTKTFIYNDNNDILTETTALGFVTTYTYDDDGNLTKREDPEGNVTEYEYDSLGLLTAVTDANGKNSTFKYDNRGNLTELTDPTGAKTTITYDSNGRVASVTDALGAITNYIYDAQGRLIEKADPEGSSCGCARGITKTEYNAAGEKIAEIDALGRRTEYRYNDRGLLIATILPDATPDDLSDNPRTQNEYDALDRLTGFTDELGRKTIYVYDALGREIEVIYPDSTPSNLTDNPRTKKEYDKAGRVIAEIDELGNRTEFDYDQADRLLTVTNALNQAISYTYDADGRQISMTDALGRITEYDYDDLDRLLTTNYANDAVMTTTYDPLGRVIAETDLAGNTTNYEYDALGRLTAVIDALNQRTEYKYDAVGNLIEQKDAKGNVTKFEYDSLRRLQATILPDGQRNETIHDKIGNLIEVTDFNGVVTTYKYNERNWLTEKSFSDGTPTETFTYTLTGELATVNDNRGVTRYVYDERDRLVSRTEPDNRTISYTYDKASNILTLTVPSGTTTYTYDALNRIDTVKDADNGVTDYDYDAVGNLVKTVFPNGVIENQEYDLLNRLTYLENRNSTGIISSYTYTLDAMGNRVKVVENDGRTVEYDYDNLYRLTEEKITDAVVGNKTITYTFDAVGNRLQRIDSVEGTTTYTYNNNDRLLQEALGGNVTQYQYDDEGNLTAKVENGTTTASYEWNAKGELTAVEVTENGETGRIEFEYDHNGIRVAINVDGEETRFLIDNNQQQYAQVIEEYQTDGTVNTSYTHGWDLISQDDGTNRIYYQVDGLGSTRLTTDNSGEIVVEYDYDAYGNLTRKVGDAENNYLFAGEQFDDAVDGYYLRARYYDPNTGRFASVDPFEGFNNQPITLHDYLYAGVNPINAIDPSGEVAIEYRVTLAPSLALLSTVRTATLTSNVGIFSIRSIPIGIAISCVFLKTASALYLASQGLLSESSALDCGFDVDPCSPALVGAEPAKDTNTNVSQFVKFGDEYTAIRDLRLVGRGAIPEPSQDGKALYINLPGGGTANVRDEGSGLTLSCFPSGKRPIKIRYTPWPQPSRF